jgi:alkylation response protein AidB-like acyl-CoA dehydrogenase
LRGPIMTLYQAPVRDMRFVLEELVAGGRLQSLPGLEDSDPELIEAILEEAGRFCASVLHPLNASGDREGCRYENGVVHTPEGFVEAYRQFVAGGWPALGSDPKYGGQGLPETVGALVTEMLCSSNLAFSMYPALTHGAYKAIRAHGTEAQKRRFLPALVEGRWAGTMCLTEPQCGTDLGLCRTRAEPDGEGAYRLNGTKIFISAGEHDLTENIVHLVLARLPDAPAGTRGLSLFVVPKFLVGDDGSLGARNGVRCGGIEEKMGIHASATCVLHFDGAVGHLVGEPHRGMPAMFTMMNGARLAVGIHGLGLAEVARQNAVAYARERLQGRALGAAPAPERPADPILVHPDVRRMLLTMRAYAEGCRALSVWVAAEHDHATRGTDRARREAADDFVALLTPVVKSLFTDLGSEMANLGVQVWGGHGYIRDNGMEQFVRDARICQIYEGTNGIQALDLVARKLPAHTGRYCRRFFHPLEAFLRTRAGDERMRPFVEPLGKAFARLQGATARVAEAGLRDPNEAAAAASDYLRLFGLVALGFVWARMAEVALDRTDGDDADFYRAKVATARFFFERLLPESGARFAMVMAGARTLMGYPDEAF